MIEAEENDDGQASDDQIVEESTDIEDCKVIDFSLIKTKKKTYRNKAKKSKFEVVAAETELRNAEEIAAEEA